MLLVFSVLLWTVLALLTYILVDGIRHQPKISGFHQRYVLITGCDSGFGNHLAKALDGMGFPVIAACLRESSQLELQRSCSRRLHTITLDVSRHDSVMAAFKYVSEYVVYDEGLWALVNNAGVIGVSAGPLEWLNAADFKKTYDVNTQGLIDMTLTFLPLLKRNGGRVVNMCSSAGRLSTSLNLSYSISMAAVEAFSDGLRQYVRQCDYGVSVHIIEAGMFHTRFSRRDKIAKQLQNTWDRLNPKEKEVFGDNYYHTYLCHMLNLLEVRGSSKVHKVTDAYIHALTAKTARLRYTVGGDAYFVLLLSYLPSKLVDWLLCTRYNMPGNPVPAKNSQHGKHLTDKNSVNDNGDVEFKQTTIKNDKFKKVNF